jgi:hypothetical protein
MIVASLRQLTALAALAAALMHLGIGIKLTVFQNALDGGQAALAGPVLLLGFGLWAMGCRLARTGTPVSPVAASASVSASVLAFPVVTKPEMSEACTKVAA